MVRSIQERERVGHWQPTQMQKFAGEIDKKKQSTVLNKPLE